MRSRSATVYPEPNMAGHSGGNASLRLEKIRQLAKHSLAHIYPCRTLPSRRAKHPSNKWTNPMLHQSSS